MGFPISLPSVAPGGGLEESHVGGAEGRGVQFWRNQGRQHGCQPRSPCSAEA